MTINGRGVKNCFQKTDQNPCAERGEARRSATTLKELVNDRIPHDKKPGVTAKTVGQKKYLDAIRKHDVTIGVGPAGTGKTYLAVAMALSTFREGKVSRIILTRPAVEAGEALGFLPGDLYEKIAPYLRPLHDALHDMLPIDEIQRHMERGTIEIAPLAYMRGRTLNSAFVSLDEAQNATTEQMFMFLTRLGFNSKAVVTGDLTQIDLPPQRKSGLVEAFHVLKGVEGVAILEFTQPGRGAATAGPAHHSRLRGTPGQTGEMRQILVRNCQRRHGVHGRRLRRCAQVLLEELLRLPTYALGIHVVSAQRMATLNRTWLRHAGPDAPQPPGPEPRDSLRNPT